MALTRGTRLGPYEVGEPIGVGGMGEVYRASDTNLKRAVAIKVLPESLALDLDRLARLRREAEVLASLNHPNIAQIYGLEKSGGTTALVMELVEGPTLADAVAQGPVPVDEALAIATQVADALQAAHDQGIIHRDLKPANVKLKLRGAQLWHPNAAAALGTPPWHPNAAAALGAPPSRTEDGRLERRPIDFADCTVKVLDFGLAKAMDPAAAGRAGGVGLSQSPTITTPAHLQAMTQAGIILGTAAYMSPEQARGKAVDARADIWAFGVLLYELLTGQRLFKGEDLTDVLASVVRDAPDLSIVPQRARRLIGACLQKDPKKRLQSIADARLLLDDDARDFSSAELRSARDAGSGAGRQSMGWAAAAILLAIAAASGYGWWTATRPVERPLTRLSVDLGPDALRRPRITAVLSPDGTRIVFMGRSAQAGIPQLFTRRLDEAVANPLPGTAFNALATPFFSPDGEWIGFVSAGSVRKVAAQGGAVVTIGGVPTNSAGILWGASWGEDGNIIIGSPGGLMRMPSAGGTAELLEVNAGFQVFPQILPGGQAVLFNGQSVVGDNLEDLRVEVFEFETRETKTLVNGGYWPRYLATSGKTGHLVYMRQGTLFGVAFDPTRLELRGTPTPLLEDIAATPGIVDGGGQFAFSETGTFVYLSGTVQDATYPIQWLDATGRTTPLVRQPGVYGAPRLSPDGTRLAYTVSGSKGADVWVYDVGRDTPTQLTFTAPGLRELAWAPDSRHLVFGDGQALWWIRADGSGQPQPLLEKAENPRPFSFGPDGRLAYAQGPVFPDIWTVPLDLQDPERPKPGKPEPFLVEPQLVEVDPAFSPDGKFLAYASSESGAEEVFVRPFPGPGGKWKISTVGGKFPAWSRATRELFFLGGDDRVMVVDYTIQGDSFSAGRPRAWSPTQVLRDGVRQSFDVSSDGRRVVIFPRPTADQAGGSLHATFLLNFFDEVRRRIP